MALGFGALSELPISGLPVAAGGGGTTYNESIAESIAATDAPVAAQTLVGATAESIAATDAPSAQLDAVGALAESAAATDSQAGLLTTTNAVAESIAATDAVAGGLLQTGAVEESIAATDAPAGLLAAVGAVAESIAATDAQTGLLTISGAVAEAIAAPDEYAGSVFGIFNEIIEESIAATDAFTAALVAVGAVAESIAASDEVSPGNTTYNETVAETLAVSDAPSAEIIAFSNEGARGGGAGRRERGERTQRGSARIKGISEEEIREAYETVMGIRPAPSSKPLPKTLKAAAKAAVRRHAIEEALASRRAPEPDQIDWTAVLEDIAAVEAFRAIIARFAQDEEDAILALLLVA